MFYQSLIDIETNLSRSKRTEDKMVSKYVSFLDEWLISRPKQYRHRMNPLQFSLDYEISNEISEYLFELGFKTNLFEVYYEAESELKEPLGNISQDDFERLVQHGSIIVEHPYKDENYEVYIGNINVLFSLKEKPIEEFETRIIDSKKGTAPAFTGNKMSKKLRTALLTRGTGA
ncbi:hypothetical protein P7E02_15180 [Enterococcus hulanensis]|uniref:hypothetical protein n=1 Tax=Enterococcus hulanensis TaxID=2559929 RepID=UPI0028921EFC|nr:hypothetical protein [Enterococcus hulanensis]MDT2661216.1 hypothetical protein [Enterococcus hulanensis]